MRIDTAKHIEKDFLQTEYVNQAEATVVGGVFEANPKLLRVIDGKVADAKVFIADETGHWQVDLPVAVLDKHQHSLEIYWPKHNTA